MFRTVPLPLQWTALIGLSALLAGLFTWLGLPASLLMGPMLAGIVLTIGGGSIDVPNGVFSLAQGVIGCMIAGMLAKMFDGAPTSHWGAIIAGALLVIVIATALGWLLN